jgi:hypothetical protein|tara:strand:+ start:106 stop:480 length:375 start_codon:yes stop_codon:yes gene_type:complete
MRIILVGSVSIFVWLSANPAQAKAPSIEKLYQIILSQQKAIDRLEKMILNKVFDDKKTVNRLESSLKEQRNQSEKRESQALAGERTAPTLKSKSFSNEYKSAKESSSLSQRKVGVLHSRNCYRE